MPLLLKILSAIFAKKEPAPTPPPAKPPAPFQTKPPLVPEWVEWVAPEPTEAPEEPPAEEPAAPEPARAPAPAPIPAPAPAVASVITVAHLTAMGVSPSNAAKYCDAINEACSRFQINSRARITGFVAHICTESGRLSAVRENLNYSALRLTQVWPRRFPTIAAATPYAMNPEALANKTYGDGLGNTQPGDGYRFLGRGFIQITGRFNYTACGKALGLDLAAHPELLEQPEYAALSAAWFWSSHGCNSVADADTEDALRQTTKIINGGVNGWDDRLMNWKKARRVFAELK